MEEHDKDMLNYVNEIRIRDQLTTHQRTSNLLKLLDLSPTMVIQID